MFVHAQSWLTDVNETSESGAVYRTGNCLWMEFLVVDQAQPSPVLEKLMMTVSRTWLDRVGVSHNPPPLARCSSNLLASPVKVFNTLPEIEYIMICLPAKEPPVDELNDLFR